MHDRDKVLPAPEVERLALDEQRFRALTSKAEAITVP